MLDLFGWRRKLLAFLRWFSLSVPLKFNLLLGGLREVQRNPEKYLAIPLLSAPVRRAIRISDEEGR
ncbi:MAG: hypothetical protein B7Y07_10160 [Halothiobacillus sp. 24-54-40]|nr:MAG: hypothetical protein B7X12_07205 [Halothiobacillus sp. 20-53-49]OYY36086.1 MAG: hypothetical protein B7Y58_07230 [Halothiobacillus sp. 35-54-62]OYY55105.1 MAG: hypothetical protein B7Y53_04680 [Halothiobacillus sp. 28-55-5]OYZ85824.1 MAG: hypothetical protein B7Y07_10160 [Halothiobacillus sp. 24-54-40]OZA80031.1 MAG: hypothetical protein B7X64_07570 [Halothiobacillus sp. 39-53-45]